MAASASPFNITELKKQLGPGLGLRKTKYLVEIPLLNGRRINMLCMSTSLPERNMSTTSVYHAGRKYNVRGETEYPGTYEISIIDNSDMTIRATFDQWMYLVDNSNKVETSHARGVDVQALPKMTDNYMTSINVYQLAADGQTTVRGYCLQNAFPSSIGTVTLEDSEDSSLSDFSVVFTYSEFVPLNAKEKKG